MSKHPKSEFVGYRPLFTLTDGRRFQRVEISLSGRFMLESRLEYPCHTVDISLGGMRLSAAKDWRKDHPLYRRPGPI